MTAEIAQSSRSKPVTTGVVATVLRAFVEISSVIKSFIPVMETEAVATAQIPAPAEVKANAGGPLAHNELDEQEIERRRTLVRMLFNDFWRGEDQKPASFTARLDQAEAYLNERLAANRETWRLDAATRAMLSLPPRSSSPD
jgi:hypothetical protein